MPETSSPGPIHPEIIAPALSEEPLPFATPELPGIGGVIKSAPEDFFVDEVPAYEPCGEGDFLFLRVEKRGLSAEQLAAAVAKALGIQTGDVSHAGLKDRHAVTRQWLSVPASAEARLPALDDSPVRLLASGRHRHKLRTGHLRGNRFRVVIRQVGPDAPERARAVAERLAETGFPNFFGMQRFGKGAQTALAGVGMLRGERSRQIKSYAFNRFRRKLALAAAQAMLFNAYLTRRMACVPMSHVLQGDVMARRDSGGLFIAEDREEEQARYDAAEVVHAGPIYGSRLMQAQGDAAKLEQDVLALAELPDDAFVRHGKLTNGTRRHNVAFPKDLQVEDGPGAVVVSFFLPSGSYATVLLREIIKP